MCILTPGAAKKSLRAVMRGVRSRLDPGLGVPLGEYILREVPMRPEEAVAGYWPLNGEIDIRPLLHALHARGHPVLLPVTPPRGQPLSFRRWQPGDALQTDRYGTSLPPGEPGAPDWLLVPLLAWDGQGRRLGYGGGYYDRSLAGLPRCRTIGCAYAAQRVAEVPVGPHDAPLDAVATEEGVTLFRPGAW